MAHLVKAVSVKIKRPEFKSPAHMENTGKAHVPATEGRQELTGQPRTYSERACLRNKML